MKLLSENRLIAFATVAGVLLTAGSLAFGAAAYFVRMGDDVAQCRQHEADHEVRLRVVEEMRSDLSQVKNDVGWIKNILRQDQAVQPGQTVSYCPNKETP